MNGRYLSDTIALMRPAQWPILTAQFFVGVLLLSPAAVQGGCWLNTGSAVVLAAAWLAWVVLLNGFTLAFNSSQDKDDGAVAYLEQPPQPPRGLAAVSFVGMAAGAALGTWFVGAAFGAVVAACVLLSVIYSAPPLRAKAIPGADLLINMVGYGAATTVAGVLAGRAAHLVGVESVPIANANLALHSACGLDRTFWPTLPAGDGLRQFADLLPALAGGGIGWIILGFGLLFGSLYPLTQLYQMDEDIDRGDRTLSTALGIHRSLLLALGLGVAASAAFVAGLLVRGSGWPLVLPLAALAAWNGHLILWLIGALTYAPTDHERGMYRALNLWGIVDLGLLLAWILG